MACRASARAQHATSRPRGRVKAAAGPSFSRPFRDYTRAQPHCDRLWWVGAVAPAGSEARLVRALWAACLRRRTLVAVVAVALTLVGATGVGLHLWYEATYFVSTENASVAGALVQVSSPESGRVFRVHADVGGQVRRDEPLAVVDLPIVANLPMGGSRSTFLDAHDRLIDIVSPVDGVIVSRRVSLGDHVTPNQALFTVVDTRRLWVVANVEETQIARVRPGQRVEVWVDAVQQTLEGVVEAIIPATTATFALLPQQNAAGTFTRVVQLVPVKIALRGAVPPLIVGASAKVRIDLRSAP